MRHNILTGLLVAMFGTGLISCSTENEDILPPSENRLPLELNFTHPSQTRATETAFENGDKVGLFVSEADKTLEISGNAVNNEHFTFNGSEWKGSRNLFWDKGKYNAFAYFPFSQEISSITDYPFSVKNNQNAKDESSGLGGYEASDFLFASAANIEASEKPVEMQFRHIMSKLTIKLIKGEDFEGDLPEKATVYLHNTVTSATIDLAAGIATRNVKGSKQSIIAKQISANTYTAITIPQRLENRVPLIEVVMNRVSFLYESKFLFKPGINHLVNLVVDKNPEQVKIEIGGEIVDWN